jgi:hypothetical protein
MGSLARSFQVEQTKRVIRECDDLGALKDLCLQLFDQHNAQKDFIGQLLLSTPFR